MHTADHLAITGPLAAAGIVMMAARTVEDLRTERETLVAASQAILDQADADGADVSDEDLETIEENKGKIANLDRQISAREAIEASRTPPAAPSAGRRTTPEAGREPGGRLPASPKDSARMGFKSFGEFALTLVDHAKQKQVAVERMHNVVSTFGSESVGADGGFIVPPEFRQSIWEKVNTQENLLTRCAQLQVGGNSITIPKDETTPWQTSGGILTYWEGEGDATTASKPQLKLDTLRLAKLMSLVPISEELLADGPAIESWLRMKAPAKMVAKINTAIIRGTGVGQPLGILNAGSGTLISVAKETSQDAASVWFANIVKMYGRLYAPLRGNAVWLINQDVEQSLYQMAFDPEATSKVPVYLPPGGLSTSPYGTLLGRPVIPAEACSTLGTQGDIILTDLSQYLALTKAGGGVQTDVSMHLYFDQAVQAFRFIFRVNGQPLWGSTIARENGSNTLGAYITLDARA
jgi:HK97 family phage major capsid protein